MSAPQDDDSWEDHHQSPRWAVAAAPYTFSAILLCIIVVVILVILGELR